MAEAVSPAFKRCSLLKGCTSLSANVSADRISKLSDTTLTHVLSFLNVKEAARCDVLSSRWRGLWKRITRLDFDASKEMYPFHMAITSDDYRLLIPSRSKYVTWVNQVLSLHASPTLDEFRVQFDLHARARKDIDRWVMFAISKRVKKLEIDLYSFSGNKKYAISPELCHYLKSPAVLSDVKHLTSLSLTDVYINGELVEYFLANCPHLERLDVSFSRQLTSLKVVGPSLPLKYLRLVACFSLESIELSAPKLTTFSHYGKPPVFLIGDNPLLTELFIGGHRYSQVAHALDAFSNVVANLETLNFAISMLVEKEIYRVAEFTNLRHLTLEVVAGASNLMPLADLIFAAPSLQKVTLQLSSTYFGKMVMRREAKRLIQRHQCLEEVEIRGFRGGFSVIELLDFLFANTAGLKKVVIDPYETHEKRPLPGEKRGEEILRSLKVARQFKKSLPHGVQLVVMK